MRRLREVQEGGRLCLGPRGLFVRRGKKLPSKGNKGGGSAVSAGTAEDGKTSATGSRSGPAKGGSAKGGQSKSKQPGAAKKPDSPAVSAMDESAASPSASSKKGRRSNHSSAKKAPSSKKRTSRKKKTKTDASQETYDAGLALYLDKKETPNKRRSSTWD